MRALVYLSVWLGCNVIIAGCVAEMAGLGLFFTVIGPFAPVYVAARLGCWLGWGVLPTLLLMVAGLALYGSVRHSIYRHSFRRWHQDRRVIHASATFRANLWRRYRDSGAESDKLGG
jgi:hypothetical protein